MGWLIGPTIFAFAASWLVVRIFKYIFSEVGSLAQVAGAGLFVATWTAVTAKLGMHGFNKKVRQLRQGNANAIKALTKGERP